MTPLPTASTVLRMERAVGDEVTPQLPPRDPSAVRDERAQLDLAASASSAAAIGRVEWEPYVDPDLLSLLGAKRVLVSTRVTVGVWSVALVASAVIARRNVGTDIDAGDGVRVIGAIGIVAAAVAALGGWYWSDRLTRNVQRLGSRLPRRRRCVSAWVAPLLWAGLLSATVLQLDPTELVDVRPVIAIAIFTAAMIRPYALCRRLVKSLSRVDADVLIGTAFVLDLAGFGLVWWQLWTWPGTLTQANLGAADTLIGLGGAAMVALGANVVVWHLLVRDLDAKLVHRTVALRTRDEHRQLRLRGIDPMDPEVRWALLRIRQEKYAAEQAEHAADEDETSVPERTAAHAVPATLSTDDEESSVPERTTAHAVPATLSTDDEESSVPERTTAHAVPATLSTDDPPADATTRAAEPSDLAAVDTSAVDTPPDAAAPSNETDDVDAAAEFASGIDGRLYPASAETTNRGESDHPAEDVESASANPSLERRLEDLVARRSNLAGAAGQPRHVATDRPSASSDVSDTQFVQRPTHDRVERIAQRLGESERHSSDETVLDRLARYGISPPAEARPVPDRSLDGSVDAGDLVGAGFTVQRLYVLELVRYLVLLALAATAVAAGWMITRTVPIELVDGTIPAPDVARLDLARRTTMGALGISLALASLWAATVGRWARRSGAEHTTAGRDIALFGIAASVNVAMIVFASDGSGVFALGMLVCLTTATWSISGIVRVQDWFRRRSTLTTAWLSILVILCLASWVGRFLRPIEATDAVEVIAFVGALISITAAVAVVLASLATADIEEAIRFAHPRDDDDESEPEVRAMLPFGSRIGSE